MKAEVLKLINDGGANVTECHNELKDRNYVSFTTDVWSSSANDTALLSLRIISDFKSNSAVLNAHCLTELHTGECIAAQVYSMLKEWDIQKEFVLLSLITQVT